MTKAAKVETTPVVTETADAWKSGVPEALAIAPDPFGYYADADWIRMECDWPALKPRDGFAPLWAEVDAGLSFKEALSIPLEAGTPVKAIFPHIVSRIRAWNVREFNPATGQMDPVPPPSEIGIEALLRVRPAVIEWLGYAIRVTSLHGGPNRKNEIPPSDAG